MHNAWDADDLSPLDDDMQVELDHVLHGLPMRRRNQDDIGTREYYDRLDRLARELVDKPR